MKPADHLADWPCGGPAVKSTADEITRGGDATRVALPDMAEVGAASVHQVRPMTPEVAPTSCPDAGSAYPGPAKGHPC